MTQTAAAALFLKFEAFSQEFSQLSHKLAQAPADLKEPGLPPSENLATDLLHARRNFTTLQAEVRQLADSIGVPSLPKRDDTTKLSELQTVLQTIAEVAEKKASFEMFTQSALHLLDIVLAITISAFVRSSGRTCAA